MRLLVSGATATPRRLAATEAARHLGALLTPASGNSVRALLGLGLPWACDNAAFSGFDPAAFCAMLGGVAGKERCLFVACPDVVGDAHATLRQFAVWQPVLAQLGLPVAYVGQDGAEELDLPWGRLRALFLGGTTDWKLSRAAADLTAEAKRRGKWLHMGPVNTRRRLAWAHRIGCDSADVSGFSRFPDTRIPRALRWLELLDG